MTKGLTADPVLTTTSTFFPTGVRKAVLTRLPGDVEAILTDPEGTNLDTCATM
jgi:hypothetical protein